jgi:hypothetical protein
MCTIIVILIICGLSYVAHLIIKAPYMDDEGYYRSKEDIDNIDRMDKQYD